MATVIFDFDSTLVSCESLEAILGLGPLEVTREAMEGKISFLEALRHKLSLAPLTREQCRAFGEAAWKLVTPGLEALIKELQARGVEVWIVSGMAEETVLPVARKLGIPDAQVLAVKLTWSPEGDYVEVSEKYPINRSKWEGAKEVSWSSPSIAVGDGITDWALYEKGLVNHFIAFTLHVSRGAVVDKSPLVADSITTLRQHLVRLLET